MSLTQAQHALGRWGGLNDSNKYLPMVLQRHATDDIHLAEPWLLPEAPNEAKDGEDCIEFPRKGYERPWEGTRRDTEAGMLVYSESWVNRINAFARVLEDSLGVDTAWAGIMGAYLCAAGDETKMHTVGGILGFYGIKVREAYIAANPTRYEGETRPNPFLT